MGGVCSIKSNTTFPNAIISANDNNQLQQNNNRPFSQDNNKRNSFLHQSIKRNSIFYEKSYMPKIQQTITTLQSRKQSELYVNPQDFITQRFGKITDDYEILDPPLGKGAYGEVRQCIQIASRQQRAVKIINKTQLKDYQLERLQTEVEILRTLDHPNILKIYEFYQDDKLFYIVTELCNGGELFDKICQQPNFTEQHTAMIIRDILAAVNYCHQNNICHRDLKPENILYESEAEDAVLKIIDFGQSIQFVKNVKLNKKLGTPYYIAPEVLKKDYDEKCDLWSCGIITYILLCGYPPFLGENEKQIMERIEKGLYNFDGQEWKERSQESKDFIKRLLEYDPIKRYSAEEALKDQWIVSQQKIKKYEAPLAIEALDNLKKYRTSHKLSQAIWTYIITNLITKEEKNKLLKTFQMLDLNGDGKLQEAELIQGYKQIVACLDPETEARNVIKYVDINGNGEVDYTEFVMAAIKKETIMSKQRLDATFKTFDKDNNGFISIDEIRNIFNNEKFNDMDWDLIIQEFDENGDGQISFNEFKEMMMSAIIDKEDVIQELQQCNIGEEKKLQSKKKQKKNIIIKPFKHKSLSLGLQEKTKKQDQQIFI